MTKKCPICGGSSAFYHHLKDSPILQNILFKSEEEAVQTEKVNADFYYCNHCLFLFNPDFKENDVTYDINYNNDQLASKAYQNYIVNISEDVALKCGLVPESKILEVGCGNGFFLKKVMEHTGSKNIKGYDPSYNGQHEMSDFITKDYFNKGSHIYDLIILRHCFDSFVNNDSLIHDLCDSLTDDGRIYIEAASLDSITSTGNFTMLFHECHSYYSYTAISNALKKFNLVIEYAFPLFDKNYLGIIAKKQKTVDFDLKSLVSIVNQYKKIILWGVSGRGISLLSQLSLDKSQVNYAVDINEEKQGLYVPVTGQKIISPAEAIAFEPDLIIISNKFYAEEIISLFPFPNNKQFVSFDGELLNKPQEVLHESL